MCSKSYCFLMIRHISAPAVFQILLLRTLARHRRPPLALVVYGWKFFWYWFYAWFWVTQSVGSWRESVFVRGMHAGSDACSGFHTPVACVVQCLHFVLLLFLCFVLGSSGCGLTGREVRVRHRAQACDLFLVWGRGRGAVCV